MSILDKYNEDYKNTTPATQGEAPEIPDGTYKCEIIAMKVRLSKSGSPMIEYVLKIMDGPFANLRMWKYSNIKPKAMPYIKADIEMLGIKLDKFADLEDRCFEAVGIQLEVKRETNENDYTNYYFNEVLGRNEVASTTDVTTEEYANKSDEEVPF